MAAVIDKKTILRDKRAQGIAAMGLVKREGDRFSVSTPSLRGRRTAYEVWRDEAGKVRCSCLEFEEQSTQDSAFRCEHILAVKHSLVAKNTETAMQPEQSAATTAAVEPRTEAGGAGVGNVAAASNNTKGNASEELSATRVNALNGDVAASFEREPNEAVKTRREAKSAARIFEVRSLAEHTDERENKMRNRSEEIKNAQIVESATVEPSEMPSEEPFAPIVPLAFTNTLRSLRQPIDPKLIKTREGWRDRQGNTHMVEYVEWHTVADTLDRICPTWSHSVRNVVQIGDMVAVTAAITIDGVTREGVGTGTADNETGIKKAEHDALKRAAIKFGIARDLYQRESEVIEKDGSPAPEGEFPRDPLAKSMADLVTPKQLGMIRALGREAAVDVDDECQSVLRCRTEELSKRAASSFIDHLKSLQQEAAAGGMRRAS